MGTNTCENWQHSSSQCWGSRKKWYFTSNFTEKAAQSSDGDLSCPMFSLADAVANLKISDPNGMLTIEK